MEVSDLWVGRGLLAAGGSLAAGGLLWAAKPLLQHGVTCGGKTTLASRLLAQLVPALVFHQDRYFLPDDSPRHVRVPGLATPHNNYDILGALDMDSFHRDVLAVLSGEQQRAHESNLERAQGKTEIPGKRFLIIEGFTALNYEPLNELCDLRYYLTLEYGECAQRRAYRLYEPPDVPGYFEACVWPEHLKYRALMEGDQRVRMVDGRANDAVSIVLADVARLGGVHVTTPATQAHKHKQ